MGAPSLWEEDTYPGAIRGSPSVADALGRSASRGTCSQDPNGAAATAHQGIGAGGAGPTGPASSNGVLQHTPGGEGSEDLRTGEARVRISRGCRAGGGRKDVRVRVVGDGAFGWAEAASVWGANVEIIVMGRKIITE